MAGVLNDLRHAARLYARTPLASLLAVVILAIGIAFVGAFVSLYVDLALRPHPGFAQGGRLITIGPDDRGRFTGRPSGIVEAVAAEASSVEAVAASIALSAMVGAEREMHPIELVSAQFFDGLQAKLALGRGFSAVEHLPGAERVVVISHRFWQSELAGDDDVIGTTIEIEREQQTVYMVSQDGETVTAMQGPEISGHDFRIIGVMADSLPGAAAPETAFWLPLEGGGDQLLGQGDRMRGLEFLLVARRAAGVGLQASERDLSSRFDGRSAELRLPSFTRLRVIDGVVRDIGLQRDARRQLELFLIGSVLLAIVSAANVSLFLLARAPGRRRELGIRLAVGAQLRRLARQLVTEAGVLVAAAAALGLLFSVWLSQYLRGLAFLQRAEWQDVSLSDWRVLTLLGAMLVVLTAFVSLAPVLGLKRTGIAATSRQVAARPTLAQGVAGTAQMAIAGIVGGAAFAFAWYLGSLTFESPGYRTDDRYLVELAVASRPGEIPPEDFLQALERGVADFTRARDSVASIPGVVDVAFGSPIPGAGVAPGRGRVSDPADPENDIAVRIGTIDGRFVDVLGLRLVRGRGPEASEIDVALVNRSFARRVFGRDDVLGEKVDAIAGGVPAEIVGVLEDLSYEHPAAEVPPLVLIKNASVSFSISGVVVTPMSSTDLRRSLENLASGDTDIEVGAVTPLASLRRDLVAADRARGFLTFATATLIVLLAAFGFYGTQSFLVNAGRREYAIRAALGAGPAGLGRLVMSRGLRMGLPGLVLGTLLAFIAVAWLRDGFVAREISPAVVAVAVAVGLVLLILAASRGPARLAQRLQPARLLRED